jgi:hypothetical protein
MATVAEQIESANSVICNNIEQLSDNRGLLSQNVLSQIRNLIEGVAVCIHVRNADADFEYAAIGPAISYVKRKAKLNFLGLFYELIKTSASHYTLAGDPSERLMLKYYEYLIRTRRVLEQECGLKILENLEDFPIDQDPSLKEYHEKIGARIEQMRTIPHGTTSKQRYYIHKVLPFFVFGRIYYEVTFYRAINNINKFDRIIAFTDIDISDRYASELELQTDSIEVFGQTMPIVLISHWEVSIRPCEINNFARLLGVNMKSSKTAEYRYLMSGLTLGARNLLDLIDMGDEEYARAREGARQASSTELQIFPLLDQVREIDRSGAPGKNVLRYLLYRMHNLVLKPQFQNEPCSLLSEKCLQFGCIPFDTMPFCTSLPNHNPRYWDVVESLDVSNRSHELLARRVHNNVEQRGVLYTPVEELERFGDVEELVNTFNRKLYPKHFKQRHLEIDKDHVFIQGYEDNTVSIIKLLRDCASTGINGYSSAVERWLSDPAHLIDDEVKRDALKLLFSQSRVALIYGAAGTGKSTMVNHVANYFSDSEKLFLAHTHPAIDNLRRKVNAQNSDFRTVSSAARTNQELEYDLLVIDECSTVSNSDLLAILENVSFSLLVLVGDIYQIESIQFGNWFSVVRSFIPETAVFELTTPFRTQNEALLELWTKTREIDDDLVEVISRNGYSSVLDQTLLQHNHEDEIILCLNYDGLYGINNINRFLQSGNPEVVTHWREASFKVGDPVLFHETERFRPVIYNNLKGRIVAIEDAPGWIQFDVELDRHVSAFEVQNCDELEWVQDSTVRFTVYDHPAQAMMMTIH